MNINKTIGKIVSVTMAVMAVCSAVPVFAGSQVEWRGTTYNSGSSIITTSVIKETDSSVMVSYVSGNSDFVGCNVLAKNAQGKFVDVTYYSSNYLVYYAYKGQGYKAVKNLAEETYGSGVEVKAQITPSIAGTHSGWWKADN